MKRPEPVVTTAAVIGLILTGLTFAAQRGWIVWTGEDATALGAFLEYAVPLVLPIAGAIIARRFVTPLSDPMDNEGNRLVPVTHIEAGTYIAGNVETADDFVGRDTIGDNEGTP